MKLRLILLAAMMTLSVQAEWYLVTDVPAYNVIKAKLAEGGDSKDSITIRILNLEKVEYIQNDRSQVLLGGKPPQKFLGELMKGQIVWVDQLETMNGEHVAHVFPSYEQVVRVFMKYQMTGSFTIDPNLKMKIQTIYKRMLSNMNGAIPPSDTSSSSDDSKSTGMAYDNDYLKALFVYDSLNWFKQTGQYLPGMVQEMFIEWLGDYQTSNGSDARILETKLKDLIKRSDLYRDFLQQ